MPASNKGAGIVLYKGVTNPLRNHSQLRIFQDIWTQCKLGINWVAFEYWHTAEPKAVALIRYIFLQEIWIVCRIAVEFLCSWELFFFFLLQCQVKTGSLAAVSVNVIWEFSSTLPSVRRTIKADVLVWPVLLSFCLCSDLGLRQISLSEMCLLGEISSHGVLGGWCVKWPFSPARSGLHHHVVFLCECFLVGCTITPDSGLCDVKVICPSFAKALPSVTRSPPYGVGMKYWTSHLVN